jgi:hypothetical protein
MRESFMFAVLFDDGSDLIACDEFSRYEQRPFLYSNLSQILLYLTNPLLATYINIDIPSPIHECSYFAGRISETDIFLVIFIIPPRELRAGETMPASYPDRKHAGASHAI